jgi:pyruvate,water dikinase
MRSAKFEMTYLIDFEDERALRPEWVGQKFTSLAQARRGGFSVPAAVAISTEAHRYYIDNRRWPEGLLENVLEVADTLDLSQGLSIRSSGIHEDLAQQSFAGQYQTFLGVLQEKTLIESIEKCWLSAEDDGVRSYFTGSGDNDPESFSVPLMGVILQKMIHADAAGVAFGRNPLNPAREEVVIEAVSGPSEALVSGHVTPFRAFVDGSRVRRIERPFQAERTGVPEAAPPLQEEQWRKIYGLVRRLEAATRQKPLDIEWALDEQGRLWLLQYRKVTTLAESDLNVPPGVWTRKIANDLWADRLTPFLAREMLTHAHRFNFARTLKIMGIPVVEPTLAVIEGYLYVNCESIAQLISYLPAQWRTADLRALFPDVYDFEAIPTPGPTTFLTTVMRCAMLPVLDPEVNPFVSIWRNRRHQKKVERRLAQIRHEPRDTADQALRKTRHALGVMRRIQVTNQWPYFYATFFTVLLRWLIVDLFGRPHEDFLRVISAGGENITIDIERRFRALARKISSNPLWAKTFVDWDPVDLPGGLPESLQADIDRFLETYGCRSRHRTLYIKRWAEAPDEVVRILQALVKDFSQETAYPASVGAIFRTDPSGISQVRRNDRYADFSEAPLRMRVLLRFLHPMARRFLDLRENLRFLLDKALYEIRRALVSLGRHTGLGERVLFLELEELSRLCDGRLAPEAALDIAAERHRLFMTAKEIPAYYIDGRPVEEFPMAAGVLRGIGTSPGRAVGHARIVTDPAAAEIRKGDILVAENTDPGWTPILSRVGGMIMEEGGLLNHCSIVARELKIPAIVGVYQATRRIREGDRVMIDGGLGLVRIDAQGERTPRNGAHVPEQE